MPLPDFDTLLQDGRYSSRLPETWPGAPTNAAGVPEDWAQRTVEAATLLAGHLVQNVAIADGWSGPLGELEDMVALGRRVAGSDGDPLAIGGALLDFLRSSDLVRAALGPSLAAVQAQIVQAIAMATGQAAAAVAGAMPVIGWAVTIIRFAVQAAQIRAGQGAASGATPLIEGYNRWSVPEFSRGQDDDEANRMLDVLRSGDWTSIWMPTTSPWGVGALNWGGRLGNGQPKVDGWRFGPGLGELERKNFACVPGAAQTGDQFYGPIDFYARRKASDLVPVRSLSDVYPSANMLAGLAWARLQVPCAQICNVDYGAVGYAWGVWQGRGRQWLETPALSQYGGADAPKINALRTLARGALGLRFDDNGRPLRTQLYPGADRRGGPVKPVRDMVADALVVQRERTRKLLGTVACAYVPPSAPALRDVELKVRYAVMRNALLEHPARFDVEIALVPDAPYRAMLHAATVGQAFAAPGGGRRRQASIDGSSSPSSPRLPDVPGGQGAGGSGGMVAAFLGALALAGFAWSRVR